MKIYTKKGDAGETGLFGNVRVPKDDLRIRAYGTLDELNTVLGLALSDLPGSPGSKDVQQLGDLPNRLSRIQNELFQLGAELATPRGKDPGIQLVQMTDIHQLEKEIDAMESVLPPLKTFVLPGGSRLSAELQLARTVCRRAERESVTLNRAEPLRAEIIMFLNRLSDYLFVCARFANHCAKTDDIPWIAPSR